MKRGSSQPPPIKGAASVPDALIASLTDQGELELANLVRERDALGRERYGTPLETNNGRDMHKDARDELGDLLQYTYAMHMTGDERLEPLLEEMKRALQFLLKCGR